MHTGFQQVLKHGIENEVIHADAWTKLKATKHDGCNCRSAAVSSSIFVGGRCSRSRHVERLKEEIFEIAVRNRTILRMAPRDLGLLCLTAVLAPSAL